MTHVYQPAMLIQLFENGGRATASEIAKSILVRDPTQVEYYEAIAKRYPGQVLTRNRGLTERDGDTYHLKGFEELSDSEVAGLVEICEERIESFLKAMLSLAEVLHDK